MTFFAFYLMSVHDINLCMYISSHMDRPAWSTAEKEIKRLRAKIKFLAVRQHWRGVSSAGWQALSEQTQYEMLSDGKALLAVQNGLYETRGRPRVQNMTTTWGQVGGGASNGRALFSLLRFDGNRPVWSGSLLNKATEVQRRRGIGALSPHNYPHAASDIIIACEQFVPSTPRGRLGVFSSISPWVELTLLKFNPSATITTVDYNPPCSVGSEPMQHSI